MEYINVSQFYESILCFSIPLLIIQRFILIRYDLSIKYEDYRRTFYQDEFKFTKEYLQHTDDSGMPIESTVKDQMLEKRQKKDEENLKELNEISQMDRPEDSVIRSRLGSITKQQQSQFSPNKVVKNNNQNMQSTFKRNNKIAIDLQTDRQLKNAESSKINEQTDAKESPKLQKKGTSGKQQISSQPESQIGKSKADKQKQKIPQMHRISDISRIDEQRFSKVTQSDVEYSRQTHLERDSVGLENNQIKNEGNKSQKLVIELGRGQLQHQGQKDKVRMKYCRRIDDAFNDYIPIILSVIVLGIITQSVFIYSMCCFFGFAFSALLFNYAHLLDRLERTTPTDSKSFFGRANQLISSLFIIGLFISYWIARQFY